MKLNRNENVSNLNWNGDENRWCAAWPAITTTRDWAWPAPCNSNYDGMIELWMEWPVSHHQWQQQQQTMDYGWNGRWPSPTTTTTATMDYGWKGPLAITNDNVKRKMEAVVGHAGHEHEHTQAQAVVCHGGQHTQHRRSWATAGHSTCWHFSHKEKCPAFHQQ